MVGLQEFAMVLQPEISVDEINGWYSLFGDLASQIRILRDTHAQAQGDSVKKDLLCALMSLKQPIAGWVLDFDQIAKHTERLQLLAAALPPEGEKRDVQLRAAEFLQNAFALVQAIHGGANTADDDDQMIPLIKQLQTCLDSLEKKSLDEMSAEAMKALQIKGFDYDMTPEVLAKTFMGLEKDALKIISNWGDIQANWWTHIHKTQTGGQIVIDIKLK